MLEGYPGTAVHSLNPLVLSIDGFIEKDDLSKMEEVLNSQLYEPALTSTPNGTLKRNTYRVVDQARLSRDAEVFLEPYREKVTRLLNFSADVCEPIVALRYELLSNVVSKRSSCGGLILV